MPERLEQLRAILARRLECVRGGMTDAEFARLVADVARTTLRFEEIDARERATKTPLPGSKKPSAGASGQTSPR
jgi:hypothetical protein